MHPKIIGAAEMVFTTSSTGAQLPRIGEAFVTVAGSTLRDG
ncbi:hypothetical protein [Nocardia sp. CA-290969]